MLRRITWLIPVLALLTLSGCIIFPTAAGMAIIATTRRKVLATTTIVKSCREKDAIVHSFKCNN